MVGRRSADDRPISRPISYLNETLFIGRCVGRPSADHRPIVARLKGNRPTIGRTSADDRSIVKFCDFLRYSARYVFNVIASVGRQNDVYRPIKIQKSYRPTVFFNVIAAITLKTYLTDYLKKSQNFTIDQSSADNRPIVGRLPLSRATIGR